MNKNMIKPSIGILLCINTMIGAGLFINPGPLTKLAGPLGFLGYALGALLFLPLILCIAELARLHPVSGGLYVYSKIYVGNWAGFLSGWAYFLGKTTSVAVLTHKVVGFLQTKSVFLNQYPILLIDYLFIAFLIALNIMGTRIGGRIQYLFTSMKAIPLIMAFVTGCYFFMPDFFVFGPADVYGVLLTLPIAVFPLMGFEVICSVGHLIEGSSNNIKRVILTAFCIVASIDILFQAVVYGVLGNSVQTIDYPMIAMINKLLPSIPMAAQLINAFVFVAILGACFSILTSNCWNLYTLAKHNHLPFASLLTKVTKSDVPWVSISIQGALACLILFITSEQTSLQAMSVFSQVIAFSLSALAAFFALQVAHDVRLNRIIPVLGMGASSYIMYLSFQKIVASGISFSFLAIFVAGTIAALYQRVSEKKALKQNNI
ncbi:MAG: amino acid permease [Candidatus Babeliales bacterium]